MTSEPDPPERIDGLDHPVLLFDGVCTLCNAAVRLTVRFDESGTFRFAPLQSEVGHALLDHHDLPTDAFDSFVLVDGEDCYTRSTAALRVCRELDGPWPLLYPLVYSPESVRDSVYDLIAKHRHRIFGRKDECPIPPPELRERFVERSLDSV